MTDPDFRAAKPKPPSPNPNGPDPEEPQPAPPRRQREAFTPPVNDPLLALRQVASILRPMPVSHRRMVLEVLLEISE